MKIYVCITEKNYHVSFKFRYYMKLYYIKQRNPVKHYNLL